MQSEGLISKQNRPITTDTTLTTPTQVDICTLSVQVEVWTVPENQKIQDNDNSINDSSVTMINRSIAKQMNRTLPPTSSARPNITSINTQPPLSQ